MEKNKEVEEQSTSDLIQIKKSNFNKKSILQRLITFLMA
jgi:hypothetical protein